MSRRPHPPPWAAPLLSSMLHHHHQEYRQHDVTTGCVAGAGASPEGNRPFLDVLDLETKQTQRLWQSQPPFFEDTGSLLCDQHDQTIK